MFLFVCLQVRPTSYTLQVVSDCEGVEADYCGTPVQHVPGERCMVLQVVTSLNTEIYIGHLLCFYLEYIRYISYALNQHVEVSHSNSMWLSYRPFIIMWYLSHSYIWYLCAKILYSSARAEVPWGYLSKVTNRR